MVTNQMVDWTPRKRFRRRRALPASCMLCAVYVNGGGVGPMELNGNGDMPWSAVREDRVMQKTLSSVSLSPVSQRGVSSYDV